MNNAQPFDVSKLEDEIAEITSMTKGQPIAPYAYREDLDLGRITADAVRASHEEAAKAITELGLLAVERVKKLDQMKVEAEDLAQACLDLAAQYRSKGDRDAEVIETTHRLNDEARQVIEDMRKKLEART